MSLDVWFQQDIKHTLLAINQTSLDTTVRLATLAGDTPELQAYRSGYNDALRAVAIAFGIAKPTAQTKTLDMPRRLPRQWEELTDGYVDEAEIEEVSR